MEELVEITRKCGHKETIKISYTEPDEREWKIWEELDKRPLCRECWEKENKAAKKAAAKKNKENGLPRLKGSAKQVAWAEAIRAEKLRLLKSDPSMGEVESYFSKITQASEWIDIRFMDAFRMKREMARRQQK